MVPTWLSSCSARSDYEVHGLVRRSSSLNRQRIDHLFSYDSQIRDRFHLHYADLADASSLSTVMELVRPDEVYNLGAQSHVRVSFDQPLYTADVVGLGTLRLLEAVRQLNRVQAGEVLPGIKLGDVRFGASSPGTQPRRSTREVPMRVPSFTPTGRRSIIARRTGCSHARESCSITRAHAGENHS